MSVNDLTEEHFKLDTDNPECFPSSLTNSAG